MQDDKLSEEQLTRVRELRDSFQSQIENIHKIEFETFILLQDRQLNWQNNIATACISIAIGLISLLFFSRRHAHLVFYIGIGLIFLVAFIIQIKQKVSMERDMNTKAHATLSTEFTILKLVHRLNKALVLNSREQFEKYLEESNSTVDKILKKNNRSSSIAFWNDVYVSLFLFSVGLISYEVWPFFKISYYIFIVSLFWALLGLAIHSYREAKSDTETTKGLVEKIEQERRDFFEWRNQQGEE